LSEDEDDDDGSNDEDPFGDMKLRGKGAVVNVWRLVCELNVM
jgi:hypothetical protein